MNCATHPQIETFLRCNRCEKPICPQCMVSAPVGFRCWDCAHVRALPALNLRPVMLVRGLAAAAGMVFADGLIWALVFQTGFLMGLIIAGAGVGYLTAEAVSRASGRRTSPALPWMAGASAGLSLLAGNAMNIAVFTNLGWGFAFRHSFELGIWSILSGLLAMAMAWGRLRS